MSKKTKSKHIEIYNVRIERSISFYFGDELVWRAYFNTEGGLCWSFEHPSLIKVIKELLKEITKYV